MDDIITKVDAKEETPVVEKKKYPPGKHPNTLKALREHKHTLTREDAVKGAIAVNLKKKKRKTFKKELLDMLEMEINVDSIDALNGDIKELLHAHGYDVSETVSVNEAIALVQLVNAIKGDNRAFENVRDSIGERPIEKAEHSIFSEGLFVTISDGGDDDKPKMIDEEAVSLSY